MIALFNFDNKYCPHCGHFFGDPYTRKLGHQDFLAGASCTCPKCGLHFAYAPSDKLLAATVGNGDLTRYVKMEDEQ